MDFDVVVVGAGPAGLATAIRLKQLAAKAGTELSVVVLEKGSEVGAHILSGAVIDPIGLTALIPDWKAKGAPVETAVTEDRFYYLGPAGALRIPNFVMPPLMSNHGNYIISLGNLCKWLGEQAAELGVEVFPGFAAAEVLLRRKGRGRRRRHGRHGHRQGRQADRPLPARHGAQRQVHHHRRGRARLAGQGADRQIPPGGRASAAEVCDRPQGAVGGPPREPQAGARAAHAGLAAVRRCRWRLLPLPLRQQPGFGRLRRLPQLQQSRICRPTASSSASRRIRSSAAPSRAAGASPTAPGH